VGKLYKHKKGKEEEEKT